jgi:hypothetical protein
MRVRILAIGIPKTTMKKIKISHCQTLSDPMFHLPQARTPLNVQ